MTTHVHAPRQVNRLELAPPGPPPPPSPDFGFPACYGYGTPDPASDKSGAPFNPSGSCDGYRPAALEFPAHAAPLGVRVRNRASTPICNLRELANRHQPFH